VYVCFGKGERGACLCGCGCVRVGKHTRCMLYARPRTFICGFALMCPDTIAPQIQALPLFLVLPYLMVLRCIFSVLLALVLGMCCCFV
jgi:hypothetical protein